jgi:hypothetical protein
MKYRMLKKDEIIKEGDEVRFNFKNKPRTVWVPAVRLGETKLSGVVIRRPLPASKPKPAKVRRAMPGDCDKCILDRFCAIPREGWRRKKDCKSYRDKIRRYMVGAKEGA